MAQCGKCIGGYWKGKRAYPCFTCAGTGVARVRQSRARREAAAVSTGLLLQIDAMPTLEEARAGREVLACTVRPGSVVARMGAGGQRLRASARVRLVVAPVADAAAPVGLMGRPLHDDSVVQRADVGGRVRTYAEIFGPEGSEGSVGR